MEYHEVALLFPELEQEAFLQLVADIRAHGLLEPISTYQGKVIDGRHRHRACKLAGVEPSYREWHGRGSLVSFVVSLNLHRRHLTSSQRAVIALDVERMLSVEAYHKQQLSGGDRKSDSYRLQVQMLPESVPQKFAEPIREAKQEKNDLSSQEDGQSRFSREAAVQAGKMLGTNHDYVRAAKRLQFQAPELLSKVRAGILTLPDARTIARLGEQSRREEALCRLETGEVKTARAAVLATKVATEKTEASQGSKKPVVVCTSLSHWLPTQPMCDLLLTDPPYLTETLDMRSFAASWLPLALSRVKSTGRAYVFIGAYKEEMQAYLDLWESLPLPLQQILVWSYKNTLGPAPSHRYKQNWQAILYFCGADAPPLNCPTLTELFSVQEVNAPDGRVGQRYHRWQKPDALAERLIRHATRPGDLVLDPFCGTGTFVLAAQRLGREGRGCDISSEMLEIAQRRGCLIGEPSASAPRAEQQSRA